MIWHGSNGNHTGTSVPVMTQATDSSSRYCIVNHPYFALINKQMLTKNAVLIDWHQFKLAPKLPLQTLLKPIKLMSTSWSYKWQKIAKHQLKLIINVTKTSHKYVPQLQCKLQQKDPFLWSHNATWLACFHWYLHCTHPEKRLFVGDQRCLEEQHLEERPQVFSFYSGAPLPACKP